MVESNADRLLPAERTDAQLIESLPPRPWDWTWVAGGPNGGGHVYLTDATGKKIGAIWGREADRAAIAEFIARKINAVTA